MLSVKVRSARNQAFWLIKGLAKPIPFDFAAHSGILALARRMAAKLSAELAKAW
jgi:hypothetical protein